MNSKKIGTFLMIMLVICAVLLLMSAAQDKPSAGPTEPMQTTGSAPDLRQPESEPDRATQPSEAPPAESTGEPVPEQDDPVRARVEQILKENALVRTAATRYTREEDALQVLGAVGRGEASAVRALAELARDRQMNPIAAFWLVVYEDLYEKREDTSGVMKTTAFEVPAQAAKRYAYTDEGARQLLTDLLTLSGQIRDELALETALLGADGSLEPEQVLLSGADDCRYAYFSCSSDYATHILCFYLRGDDRGEWIDDVELQLLSMRHAEGDTGALALIDGRCDRQAASLMAAAELLMTGTTGAGSGQIPFRGEIDGFRTSLERFRFTAEMERGALTNYRIRSK